MPTMMPGRVMALGSSRSRRSVTASTISALRNMRRVASSGVGPKARHAATNVIAVATSTSGYIIEMRCPHPAQRARSPIQLTIGTFSYQRSARSHCGHREPGSRPTASQEAAGCRRSGSCPWRPRPARPEQSSAHRTSRPWPRPQLRLEREWIVRRSVRHRSLHQQLQRRGLAGAVRAQEPEDLAGCDVEREPVESAARARCARTRPGSPSSAARSGWRVACQVGGPAAAAGRTGRSLHAGLLQLVLDRGVEELRRASPGASRR